MARQQLLMDWRTSLNTLKNMMLIVVALAPATTADFKVQYVDLNRAVQYLCAVHTNNTVGMNCNY